MRFDFEKVSMPSIRGGTATPFDGIENLVNLTEKVKYLGRKGELRTVFIRDNHDEDNARFLHGMQTGWIVVTDFAQLSGGEFVTEQFNEQGRFFVVFKAR